MFLEATLGIFNVIFRVSLENFEHPIVFFDLLFSRSEWLPFPDPLLKLLLVLQLFGLPTPFSLSSKRPFSFPYYPFFVV